MGDKSPKAKDKNKKQSAGVKSQKKADAANKAMSTGTKKVK
jgi:hypothetical protein